MFKTLPYKTKQFFFVLIKLSIVFGAFYFIYMKLTQSEQLSFQAFLDTLKANRVVTLKNISFLVLLSVLNWFFEVLKWQQLVKEVKFISFKIALKQCLSALTASMITPNRVGDFAAKALWFKPSERKAILALNALGHLAQFLTTCFFGLFGLIVLNVKFPIEIEVFKLRRLIILITVLIAFLSFGMLQKQFTIKGFSVAMMWQFVKRIPVETHVLNGLFSILRYLLFSFQFYIILCLFDVELSYYNAMIGITSYYFISSIIPSLVILDVVVKGSVAVYVFSTLGIDAVIVLSVVMCMWLLNFVLPGFIGSYYVLQFKPLKHV